MKRIMKIYFGLLKILVKVLINLNLTGFYHLICLCHNFIKGKLTELMEQTFYMIKRALFT